MAIFFNFSPTSNHLHPLQVGNCDSYSRLVVDEDDNGKFRRERVNQIIQYGRRLFFKTWKLEIFKFKFKKNEIVLVIPASSPSIV